MSRQDDNKCTVLRPLRVTRDWRVMLDHKIQSVIQTDNHLCHEWSLLSNWIGNIPTLLFVTV